MIQDWGGPIALGAALAHPDRMKALVVGNTMFYPVDDDRFGGERFFSARVHRALEMGRLVKSKYNIFQIETVLNNRVWPGPCPCT